MCQMCQAVQAQGDCVLAEPVVVISAAPAPLQATALADNAWAAVELISEDTFTIDLAGAQDTQIAVYDANGLLVAQGKADGSILLAPPETGTYYITTLDGTPLKAANLGVVSSSLMSAAALPVGTPAELAAYLATGFWRERGAVPLSFDTSASNVITFNLTGITADKQAMARHAFAAFEMVGNLDFVEVTSGGKITFDDNQSGNPLTTVRADGSGNTTSAVVAINSDFLERNGSGLGSYGFQTFMHEIGHALGLGHMGPYSGSADYPVDARFANDSWQVSVMSYFSQTENTSINASRAAAASLMIADILAIQSIYGAPVTGQTSGNTVWGQGTTLTNFLGKLFDGTGGAMTRNALTIYDSAGRDTIDFSNDTAAQRVTLAGGGISDVYGLIGNLIITTGTVIEDYHGGSAGDRITGNDAANSLSGRAGNDAIAGLNGNDKLSGGEGADSLTGDAGNDTLTGDAGGDVMDGGAGNDSLLGSDGNDTLRGAAGIDRLDGGAGNDRLEGGTENDALYGGDTDDTVLGGDGVDSLSGGDGNDSLKGDAGGDNLSGNNGNDRIEGGTGNDTLQGGGGKDNFVFASGADRITDFVNDADQLVLDDALWGGRVLSVAQVLDFATVSGTALVFNFGGGNTLTVANLTDESLLLNDITIF